MVGKIEVIVGPMFAWKTSALIQRIQKFNFAKKKYVVFKNFLDKRYSTDNITSHDGVKVACYPIQKAEEIVTKYNSEVEKADIVAIDEVQFFEKSIIDVIRDLANKGKHVIVVGLDMDFMSNPFGPIGDILAIADKVKKMKAICTVCGEDAMFSKRLKCDKETILVGGDETYEPRCRKHFLE